LPVFQNAAKIAEGAGDRREAVQAHLYAGETLYRLRRYADAKVEFSLALLKSADVGLREEQWKAVYGLGRVAETRGEPAQALEQYEQALRIIESLRSGISVSSQRIGFLADKRDVYDSEIALL